jgi:4a-hydroxytetrahydrobiopterin dehydratase
MTQPARTLLTPEAIVPHLPEGWLFDGAFVHRQYTFSDFDEAWAWMNQVAEIARILDHHPEWTNVYNRVQIQLQTHDAGGVTETDLEFVRRVAALTPST